MNLFGTSTDKCLSELRKLQAARGRLEAEVTADRARLAELRGKIADTELSVLLDGGDARPMRRELVELETAISGRLAARPKLLEKIRAAIVAVGKAKAEPVWEEAKKLKEKFDAHQAETGRLLDALQQQSGVKWEMRLRPDVPIGAVYMPGELRPVMPKYVALAAEAQLLMARAEGIESAARNACSGGSISGVSLNELLAPSEDIEKLAPSRVAIEAWFDQATARADTMWQRTLLDFPNGGAPSRETLYTLNWDGDGNILATSAVVNHQVRPAFRVALQVTKDEATGRMDSRVVSTPA